MSDKMREALELAELALSGANMNMNVVKRKVREALAARPEQSAEPVAFRHWYESKRKNSQSRWSYYSYNGYTPKDPAWHPLYTAPPAPSVPDGYAILPRTLTAENGAKGALIGEFEIVTTFECRECIDDDDEADPCKLCGGRGYVENNTRVDWTTIKAIWRKAVEHFDAQEAGRA